MREIRLELENWGRWAADRYHKQHCASLEHRYRRKIMEGDTPTGWGDWQTSAPEAPLPPLDILAAVEVQKVIGKLGFEYAWALTFAYCYPKYNRWKAAAFCGVYRPERLLKLVRKAEHMVKNNLQLVAKPMYKAGTTNPYRRDPDSPSRESESSRTSRVFLKAA